MSEEIIETVENENDEKVIINLLTEIQSSITMLTEQVTALTPVEDEVKEETDDKVEVEPEGVTDDTTEELSPEEVEKMLFEN